MIRRVSLSSCRAVFSIVIATATFLFAAIITSNNKNVMAFVLMPTSILSLTPNPTTNPMNRGKVLFQLHTHSNSKNDNNNNGDIIEARMRGMEQFQKSISRSISSFTLGTLLLFPCYYQPTAANAYEVSDYASETVQTVIQNLKQNVGSVDGTIKTYEDIAAIITEGKGVGGSVNFQGIQLERGYVSDEDTTIYNPGLTLLTESEKERLVEAIVQSKKSGIQQNAWNVDTQAGFDYLKDKLDPLHMYELAGYLKVVPIYAAVLYIAVLAVQQFARGLFPVAYFVAVAAIFGPALILISLGPQ